MAGNAIAADILPGHNWTHGALTLLEPDDWAHAYFASYIGPDGLGNIARACRQAGITKHVRDNRLTNDTGFREAHNDADNELRSAFEYVLTDRVLNGTPRPVFQRGILVGHVREVDNRLLQWTLERLMPEKYHLATKFELSGADAPGAFKFAMGEVVTGEAVELPPGGEPPES